MSSTAPITRPGFPVPPDFVVSDPQPPRPRPSIAVVAVHGVADQQPHESAGAIANLLLRVTRGGTSAYTSFRELPLRIPTAPVEVSDEAALARPTTSVFRMEERPRYLADPGAAEAAAAADQPGPDHLFMRAQLAGYEPDGLPYETIRLEGRKLEGGEPAAEVHVYEMYWADLSRLGSGFFRIFGEMYQLLLHLANLGRVVVDHAKLEFDRAGPPPKAEPAAPDSPAARKQRARQRWKWLIDKRLWTAYAEAQAGAVRLLTLFTPVLGLLMLGSIGIVLPGALVPPGWKEGVAAAVAGLGLATVTGLVVYMAPRRPPLPVWTLTPVLAGAAGAFGMLLLVRPDVVPGLSGGQLGVDRALALEWLLATGALLAWLFGAYGRRRPGAAVYGRVFLAVALGWLFLRVARTPRWEDHARDALRAFEVEYLFLFVAALALVMYALSAGALGMVLQHRIENGDVQGRARRAAWTARTTLALSTASIFVLTLVLLGALHTSLRVMLSRVGSYRPLFAYPGLEPNAEYPLNEVMEGLLRMSAPAGLAVLLGLMLLISVVAAWAILPAALTEISAPRDRSATWSRGTREERWRHAAEDGRRSERLGTWLSNGFPALAAAATALWGVFFILLPAMSIARLLADVPLLNEQFEQAVQLVTVLGSVIAASAVGLLALRGRFDVLSMGLRPALDVALDVDNYLREHPRDRTPRARIAERYASLLRYLSLWRDEHGRPYAGVVLVAHSQGTVITTDLLGFLRRERQADLADLVPEQGQSARIGTYLFTMGSPLRQLYGRAFPHLYAWVSGRPARWGKPLEPTPRPTPSAAGEDHGHEVSHTLADDAAPDPLPIGLTRWVNAYRSGDYVGRELWRAAGCRCLHRRVDRDTDPALHPPVLVVSEDAGRLRRELCIGGGAHTHYWDETAPAIADELDLLLQEVLDRARVDAAARGPTP